MSTNQLSKEINHIDSLEFLKDNLLVEEDPYHHFSTSLAERIGLKEAIILHKLDLLLDKSTTEGEGYKWIRKTYAEWKKDFPFWSEGTIKRIFQKLEKKGYIITTTDYNEILFDNTKWYRIDYDKVGEEFL
ncbi:hypothetical protein ACIQ34_00675 [Ureibacillus sp. NPDC094379]